MKKTSGYVPLILLVGYVLLFIWGAINPYDRVDWVAENVPIVIMVAILAVMYAKKVRFSALSYILMAFLLYWNTIGGHYTFERVPFGFFDHFLHAGRNMFDRVGHFSVGFFAFPILEYLLDRKKMSWKWATLFAVFAIAFVAMSYELIEWIYAASSDPAQGAAFLGSQGDIWDAQKDMLMDTLGALVAVCIYYIDRGRNRSRSHKS
jgi:putative membrane protein